MQKNKLSTYFLVARIFTFLEIFFYLVQNSYNNLLKATLEVKQSEILKPIDPNLDVSALDEISKRKFFTSQ
jgi:hypothetical protein